MSLNMVSNMSGITSRFDKLIIIKALRNFRDISLAEYKDALDVYREDVINKIHELSNKAHHEIFTTFEVPYNLGLTIPVNCDKEYTYLINLFNQVTEDTIELDFGEANRIFNNEWEWASSSSAVNYSYSSRKSK